MLRVKRIVIQGYKSETVKLPIGTRPLSVSGEHEVPRLFLLVDDEAEKTKQLEEFKLTVSRTNDPVDGALDAHTGENVPRYVRPKGKYCGTYLSPSGSEYHVFLERLAKEKAAAPAAAPAKAPAPAKK